MSLWSDPEIQKTINLMDPQTRYEYSKIGENLYKNCSFRVENELTKTDDESNMYELAAQIKLLIRDGLDVNDLTNDETAILKHVYGETFKDIFKD